MIALLLEAPPPAADTAAAGGALAAYVALGGTILTTVIAGVNAWSNRKTRRERAAAAGQAEAQGGVIATGTPLEWRTTDHQALLDERAFSAESRKRADAAEEKVRELSDRLAENDRRTDAIIEDLRQLRVSIAACPGGPACPLVPIDPEAPSKPPGSGRTQWRGRDTPAAD